LPSREQKLCSRLFLSVLAGLWSVVRSPAVNFAAVFPPMVTPFDNDDIDVRAIGANVEKWARAGVGGVVALGSNGEAPLIDDSESDRVLEAVRDALPSKLLLIAGAGRESTRATIAAATRAAHCGADAVLVRTPSYFKSRMTADAFLRHYTAVADASPVPVLLYNYPALTGVNLTPDAVSRLAQHPNVVGMKETGVDTAQFAAFVASVPASFAVIAGSALVFYPWLCVGATGGILALACVLPEACVALHEHALAGRHPAARALQQELTPLARLVTTTHGVPGLKAAMDLAGYIGGVPRSPLAPASAAAIDEIRAELNRVRRVCEQYA
jgi:4-hydroxy-2-oxoglutarate aldolase